MNNDQRNNTNNINGKQKNTEQSNFFELNKNIENASKFSYDNPDVDSIIKEKFDLVDKIYLSKKKIQEILINKNILFTSSELDNIYRIAISKKLNEITFDLFLNNLISSEKINNYFKNMLKNSSLQDNDKFKYDENKLLETIKNINDRNHFNENQFSINSKILKSEIDKIYNLVEKSSNDISDLSNKINQEKITKEQNMRSNNNNLDKDFFRLVLLEEEQKKHLLDLQTDKLRRIFFNEIRSLYNFNNNSIAANNLNDINMHNFHHNPNNMDSNYNQIIKNRNNNCCHPISHFKNDNKNHEASNFLYNPQNENDYDIKNIYKEYEFKLNNLENLILNLYDKLDKNFFSKIQAEHKEPNEIKTNNFENKLQNLDNDTMSHDFFNKDNKNLNQHEELEKKNVFKNELQDLDSITMSHDFLNKDNKNIDEHEKWEKTSNFENKLQDLNNGKISDDFLNQNSKNIMENNTINSTINDFEKQAKDSNNSYLEKNLFIKSQDNLDNEKKKINNDNRLDKIEILIEELSKKIDENFLISTNELSKNKNNDFAKEKNDFNYDDNFFFKKEIENYKFKDEKIKNLEIIINDLKEKIELNQHTNKNVIPIDDSSSNHFKKQIENIHNDIKKVTSEIESKFNLLSNSLNVDKENLINIMESFFKKSLMDDKKISNELLLDGSNLNDKNKFFYLNLNDDNNFSKINEIFEGNNFSLKNNIENDELNNNKKDLLFNKENVLANGHNTNNINLENDFNNGNNLNNIDSNAIQNDDQVIHKNNQTSNLEFSDKQEDNLFPAMDFLKNKEVNIDQSLKNKENTENVLNETINYNNNYLGDNINDYYESLETNHLENATNDNIDDFLKNLDRKIVDNVKDLSNIKNILNGEDIDKQVLSDLDVSISLFDSMSKN